MILRSALVALLCATASPPALAQTDDVAPLVLNPAESPEIAGTWNYTTSNHKVSGRCPLGPSMTGQLVIAMQGAMASVMVASGAVCNPLEMCLYMGNLAENAVLVSNTAVVDEEGGTATNALVLSFYSAREGTGKSSSSYVHPKGFECSWSHNLTLTRGGE